MFDRIKTCLTALPAVTLCVALTSISACGPADEGTSSAGTAEATEEAQAGGVREVAQADAVALGQAGAVLLDVRSPDEFGSGHVPGAINIPIDELSGRLAELEAAKTAGAEIIVYCERGGRAETGTDLLADSGFGKLGHLVGDMSAWRDAGLDVE